MRNKIHTILFILGLLILGCLVWDFGINNIIQNVRKLGWWFIPVIMVWGSVYLINAWAWYIILGKGREKVSFTKIYGIGISGFAINYITPFVNLGGEPYKISALRDYLGLEMSISSVTLYRMIHILAHLIFWLCVIPASFFILPQKAYYFVMLISAFMIIFLLVLFFFSRHRKGIFGAVLKLLKKVSFLGFISKRLEKYSSSIVIIDEQIRDLFMKRKEAFYGALVLEFISRFVAAIEFLLILIALGINITLLQAFYIHAASSLLLNIFFFMPLEMGTREGSLFLVFHAFNFAPELSIFIGLVNRSREFFWIIIGIILIQINNRKARGGINLDLPRVDEDYDGSRM